MSELSRCVVCHSDYLSCSFGCLQRDYRSRWSTYLYCKFFAELPEADDEKFLRNQTEGKQRWQVIRLEKNPMPVSSSNFYYSNTGYHKGASTPLCRAAECNTLQLCCAAKVAQLPGICSQFDRIHIGKEIFGRPSGYKNCGGRPVNFV